MAIVEEIPGFIQVFSDGTVKRFIPHSESSLSPSSPAAVTASAAAFKSKDVVIDASKPITARIFVPSDFGEGISAPLCVIVYFHGGGFCVGSTAWPGYYSFLGGLCARCRCIVVSVDYRLAPEHRLPVAYEDCYASLKWLAVQLEDGEPWLRKADISRVFLSGESAGANIVHHLALRLLNEPVGGLSVTGLLLIHPFFGGEARMEEETAEGLKASLHFTDTFWRLSLPEGADRDNPFSNFERADLSDEEWRRFPKVAVFLAGKDLLKARGAVYGAFMKSKVAAEVSVVVAEEEVHAHNVFFPRSEATKLLQSQMAEFMSR